MYWYPLKTERVASYERMLVLRDRACRSFGRRPTLEIDLSNRLQMERYSMRDGWLIRDDLDLLKRSGKLDQDVRFLDSRTTSALWFGLTTVLKEFWVLVFTRFGRVSKTFKLNSLIRQTPKVETTELARLVACTEASRYAKPWSARGAGGLALVRWTIWVSGCRSTRILARASARKR